MNKIFGGLMLLYGLFVLIVVAGGSRWLKNLVGTLNGWGKCPSCGDTWWGKKGGMILYEPLHGEPPMQASLSLCLSCLANPSLLDVNEIVRNLNKEGCSAARVLAGRQAILRFQAGGGNLRRL